VAIIVRAAPTYAFAARNKKTSTSTKSANYDNDWKTEVLTAMRLSTTSRNGTGEIAILARILGNDRGALPTSMARYILNRNFNERDKVRMHELITRNQAGSLSAAEKEELMAYARAGTLLSILKSKARRTLRMRITKRIPS
jgi:hypothetical protein